MKRSALVGLAAALGLALLPTPCAAEPQWNVGVETGLCGRGSGSALGFDQLGWCNALRGDVLLLRERSDDFGLGPSLRLGTVSFDDFRVGAGLSVLLPVLESFPVVLDAGPQLRNLEQPGVYGSVFFGLRSFNHYGHYSAMTGLAVSAERSFSAGNPSILWLTARIDGSWLALPLVFIYNAAK